MKKDKTLENLKKRKANNFKDRLKFIDQYVLWLEKTSDKEWSKQQKDLIN
jgi:hypothetical protein